MTCVSTALGRLFDALAVAAALILFAMVAIVTADVALRNVIGAGIAWANEISEYALYVMTLLTAPWLLRRGQRLQLGDTHAGGLVQQFGQAAGVGRKVGALLDLPVAAVLGHGGGVLAVAQHHLVDVHQLERGQQVLADTGVGLLPGLVLRPPDGAAGDSQHQQRDD